MNLFYAYIAIGIIVGFLSVIVSLVLETNPPDMEDNMMTFGACTVFWPIAIVVGTAYGLVKAATILGLALRNKLGGGLE